MFKHGINMVDTLDTIKRPFRKYSLCRQKRAGDR